MKASIYLNYTARSLVRGGQRTVLAIFCVAVGVMAIVSLQLVGLMINNAFNSNVRDANGGDIAVRSQNQPFRQSDLDYFTTLKKAGTITDYTPVINAQGYTSSKISLRETFGLRVVDPASYPVVTPPTFALPQNGKLADLLRNNQVIVTQSFVDQYKKKIGGAFELHTGSRTQSARIVRVKIAGIVSETGVLAQAGSVVILASKDYTASAPKLPTLYDTVDVTTSAARINSVVKNIQSHFPVASTQTASDVLRQQQSTIDNIQKFLEIAGLLALLIGGVGIVNTMQVLLSRRKTEIAMLKTTGYRRIDLYLLFGLEAGLLGLIGGILGAIAATGVSYLVRNLVEQTFTINIPFLFDWFTIVGGIVIGLLTALIFGLLPIVQAANIRPLNVIRDLPEGRGAGSILLTIGLLAVLSILFCVMAIVILNGDILLGLYSVYGTFAFLALLSVFFGLVIFVISALPVPEQVSRGHIALILTIVVIAALVYLFQPVLAAVLLLLALSGLVVVFLPRTWKATIKMALRNLGRQRTRTTTTMLALFVGIFTIGLILVLGQDLREQVNKTLANTLNYNVFSITSNDDTAKLRNKLGELPGLSSFQQHTFAVTSPESINGTSIQKLLPNGKSALSGSLGRGGTLFLLSGVEGYDVGNNQLPRVQSSLRIKEGRNLTLEDAGTDNVVVSYSLRGEGSLHLKLGDRILLASVDRLNEKTVRIVGFYNASGFGSNLYPILGTVDTARSLSPVGTQQAVFYMKIDAAKLNAAIDMIGNTVPNAFILNLANISDFVNQLLNDILLTLSTIASLSLLAGVIIIANAVALAMLERRRELGILKSVGYTSTSILSEVLLENGLVGGLAAALSMLLVALATWFLGVFYFKTTLPVSSSIALAMIAGSVLLAMVTAALVAWGAVRVRPLEVLRYE
ncbi:MAG: FtsX-like permease family protein [Ktedonobacteraceae bacterium]